MRILVNLPFADLRAFSERGLAERLTRPMWPMPTTGYEFVRRFGQVKDYPSKNAPPWSGENYYCDASRLLVFDRPLKQMVQCLNLQHYGRRLLTDGKVGRTEVEFRSNYQGNNDHVVEQITNIKVRVGKLKAGRLIDSGGRMAAEYAAATLPVLLRDSYPSPLPKLVLPGKPMIVISRYAGTGAPRTDLEKSNINWVMDQQWSTTGDSRTALWTLVYRDTASKSEVERARRHAVRLHSELETFTIVLKACRQGLIDVAKSEPLNEYLYRSAKRLLRNRYDDWPQVEIYRSIAFSRQESREAELASLEETFQSVKPGMLHMLHDASELLERRTQQDVPAGLQIVQNITKKVSIVNNNNSINIGANAKVENFVGSNSTVANSHIGHASGPDLQSLVKLMLEQLREIEPLLSEDEIDFAEIVEDQVDMQPIPAGKIQSRLDKILAGVQRIGEAGAPVVQTIGEILKMLPA